jgi:YjjG family noncanonical pyrimidine nucleotidase
LKTPILDVFFDLDHTLWDFEKNSALTIKKILKKNQIPVNPDEFLKHYVPINFKYWELFREDKISKEELRFGRLSEAFSMLDMVIEKDKIVVLSEEYIQFLPENNHLFDGAFEILDYLKPKYNLHIITNGFHEVQNHKITNSKLTPYFSTITNSESAGVKKPNPIIFEFALNQANAKRESSIMIGDCINADVLGALNCGMDAILFSELPQIIDNPDIRQINNLLDLRKHL